MRLSYIVTIACGLTFSATMVMAQPSSSRQNSDEIAALPANPDANLKWRRSSESHRSTERSTSFYRQADARSLASTESRSTYPYPAATPSSSGAQAGISGANFQSRSASNFPTAASSGTRGVHEDHFSAASTSTGNLHRDYRPGQAGFSQIGFSRTGFDAAGFGRADQNTNQAVASTRSQNANRTTANQASSATSRTAADPNGQAPANRFASTDPRWQEVDLSRERYAAGYAQAHNCVRYRVAQNCGCGVAPVPVSANFQAANVTPALNPSLAPASAGFLPSSCCGPAPNLPQQFQPANFGLSQPNINAAQPIYGYNLQPGVGVPRFGPSSAQWWTPLVNLTSAKQGTYLGRGIIGQPTAYVDGEPVRNLLRYIAP